jgi:hypothetical protein
MMTGRVHLNLTDAPPSRMAGRVSLLAVVPNGAHAVVQVGSLVVEPGAVRELWVHERRLELVIEGDPHAVPNWLSAIRSGLPGELVVLP